MLIVGLAAIGATGWFVAQRRYIDLAQDSLRDLPPDDARRVPGAIYGLLAPPVAGSFVTLAILSHLLPSELGALTSPTGQGLLLTIIAGILIGVYYRTIGIATEPKYWGMGVFAVCYYLPLLGLTALAGFLLGNPMPNAVGWFGFVLALPAIALIRWRKDVSQSPSLWRLLVLLGTTILTSFLWLFVEVLSRSV